MMRRIPMTNAAEIDAFDHKRDINWRAGERAQIKRSYRRRERRAAKESLR